MKKRDFMNKFKKRILLLGLVLTISGITYYGYICRSERIIQPKVATKTIYSFLGAPGSGKGTLAERLVKDLGFKVVSTGNLCREEIAQGTDKGKIIVEYTRSARLVPDAVISEMLENWLSQQKGDQPIILDGYPRTKEQAKILAHLLKTKFPDYRFRVISLDIDDFEKIVRRMAGRLVCENKQCQATTHVSLLKEPNKFICEKCGGNLVRRDDDREEFVRKRLADFIKNNNEIIAFYKEAGIPVESVDVSNATPEATLETFKRMI